MNTEIGSWTDSQRKLLFGLMHKSDLTAEDMAALHTRNFPMPIWRLIKMATVEQLQEMMEIGLSKAKYVMLSISPGIWIDADAFRETENGILFLRKGHSSGFVHKDVFEKITWQLPVENPEHEQEVPL